MRGRCRAPQAGPIGTQNSLHRANLTCHLIRSDHLVFHPIRYFIKRIFSNKNTPDPHVWSFFRVFFTSPCHFQKFYKYVTRTFTIFLLFFWHPFQLKQENIINSSLYEVFGIMGIHCENSQLVPICHDHNFSRKQTA